MDAIFQAKLFAAQVVVPRKWWQFWKPRIERCDVESSWHAGYIAGVAFAKHIADIQYRKDVLSLSTSHD